MDGSRNLDNRNRYNSSTAPLFSGAEFNNPAAVHSSKMANAERLNVLFGIPSLYTMVVYRRPITAEQRHRIDSLNMSIALALENEYDIDFENTMTIGMALQLGYIPIGENYSSQEKFWREYLFRIHHLVSQNKEWQTDPQFADILAKAKDYLDTFKNTIAVARSSRGGLCTCKVQSFTSAGPRLGSWNFTPGDQRVNPGFYDKFLEDAKVALESQEWYGEYDMEVEEFMLGEGDKRE